MGILLEPAMGNVNVFVYTKGKWANENLSSQGIYLFVEMTIVIDNTLMMANDGHHGIRSGWIIHVLLLMLLGGDYGPS